MKLTLKDKNNNTVLTLKGINTEEGFEDAEYTWECIEEEEEWVIDDLISTVNSQSSLQLVDGDIDSPFSRLLLTDNSGNEYTVEVEE